MTWRELYREGAGRLRAAGISDAGNDARLLLFASSKLSLATYALRAEEESSGGAAEEFFALIDRRAKREPLQYILGTAPFYGRDFIVRPGVLIPRFDTETLVEAVLRYVKPGMRILDLCTGSGCVLLSLLLEGPSGVTGAGCDISEAALAVAAENAARFGVRADFVKSDLFTNIERTYDIITANPPYIRGSEIGALEPEVALHEPRTALDGGADGLDFYRRICAEAPRYLAENGILGVEIGFDQAEDVTGMMRESGFRHILVRRDMGWNTRAVIGLWNQ